MLKHFMLSIISRIEKNIEIFVYIEEAILVGPTLTFALFQDNISPVFFSRDDSLPNMWYLSSFYAKMLGYIFLFTFCLYWYVLFIVKMHFFQFFIKIVFNLFHFFAIIYYHFIRDVFRLLPIERALSKLFTNLCSEMDVESS